MNRRLTPLLAALVLSACSPEEQPGRADAGMEGMSAEEHAQHLSGSVGSADSAGAAMRRPVRLTEDQERALGVTYTSVARKAMIRSIRTVGRITAPEPNVVDVTPKIDGFVEELLVGSTGEQVRRGQPLLRLYSPRLVAAQEELLTAQRLVSSLGEGAGDAWDNATAMLDAARRRLAFWDITPEQIEQLERSGQVAKTLDLVAPVSGIVMEKAVVEGQRVMAGTRLYQLADLRDVWIEGELFEQDLQFVHQGSIAHIEVAAYPGQHLMGRVSFVHPTVDERTRTNRVRVSVRNQDLRLKPGMFTTVYFDARIEDALVLPLDAVLATGERNLVFVRGAAGILQPQDVVLGAHTNDEVQVLSGVAEGDLIVASANFLVDAESRLASTRDLMPGMQHGPDTAPSTTATPSEHIHHD